MRHFAHNIGDYAAATAHLSFVEDAAYHRLLRRYYQDEKSLPPDVSACARLAGARTREERQAVANVLAEFFTLEDDGHHQARADREIEAYQAKAQAARENGTKGGRPVNREKTKTVSKQVRSEKATTPHSPSTIIHHEAASSLDAARAIEDEAFGCFREAAAQHGWPDPQFLNSTRRFALQGRLAEGGGVEGWKQALEKAAKAEFLISAEGKPQPWFDIDWLLKSENFARVVEGRYDERRSPVASGAQKSRAARAGDGLPAVEPWEQRMAAFRASGFWLPAWGPKPGEHGCPAPKHLIERAA